MTVLRQHPALCALGFRHDRVSTDIWDSMFWWSVLTKYKCCQRAGFHFMLVQLQNKILPLENLTYHLSNTSTWGLSPFLKALNFWLCFPPYTWSHLRAPIHPHQGRGQSSRLLPAHPLRPEHSLSKLISGVVKSCSPGHDVFTYSLACGEKRSLGHWYPLFLPCSRGSISHIQALVVSLGLTCNYSRCPTHDRERGSEDAKAAEAEGHCIPIPQDNVFWPFLSPFPPILLCKVKFQDSSRSCWGDSKGY